MKAYEFVTIWRVKAPIESIWNEIYHSREWPTWWKGVESVVEVRKGDERGVGSIHRYTWKSKLPYRLSFDMKTIRIEPPRLLEGIAIGELQGRGLWQLSTEGSETVHDFGHGRASDRRTPAGREAAQVISRAL